MTNTSQTTKKQVRFGPSTEHVIEDYELSLEEHADLWHIQAEIIMGVREDAIAAATAAVRGEDIEENEQCSVRGLESYLMPAVEKVAHQKQCKLYARVVARDEDDLLTLVGDRQKVIQLQKFAISHRSLVEEEARLRAHEDAAEATKIYNEVTKMLSAPQPSPLVSIKKQPKIIQARAA